MDEEGSRKQNRHLGRDQGWRRRLRRLDLGSPIEPQLDRHRRVTIALTAVSSAVGLMFLAIFGAFGRPDVGGLLVGASILPVIGWAWLDHRTLRARAIAYLRERASHDSKSGPTRGAVGPGPSGGGQR